SDGYDRTAGIVRLPEIGFSFCKEKVAAQALLRCLDRITTLRFFGVGGCRFAEADARAIFAAPAVQQVHTLQITGTPLNGKNEDHFTRGDFPNLRRLVRVWL